ncbi:hypothetical protein [Hymenobacter actinosclerus]|uniref:Uncharacterized protein n=1 Tax=Hymenobacter actinosclerus TaxID=82805 RepID=A0A1I0FDF1_9BACT|nr:hypothetical protein [Hymenobacter actinosclerus]SET56120.1 hypothetical protein SAMN04487998_2221 [Hymenobacter actinosclerus]
MDEETPRTRPTTPTSLTGPPTDSRPAIRTTHDLNQASTPNSDGEAPNPPGDPGAAPTDRLNQIFEGLKQKSSAKQAIYRQTLDTFELLRQVSQELVLELSNKVTAFDSSVLIEYRPVNEMEFHIRFSGDLLMFVLHSNIVTFPDDYGPMPTKYVEQDFRRRFFGHIMAYNFMADSIKYQRLNDPGYLVGRLLINIDRHYFLEGVQQLELPDNDMSDNLVTEDGLRLFVESAMIAAVNNDLIAPPMTDIQKITVKQKLENQQVSRGSKVGFSFGNQQRPHNIDGLPY